MENFESNGKVGDIEEYTLKSNGLRVLLNQREGGVPVVTFNVTYLVGSKDEKIGTTGATHILEHLQFKGSKKFNKEDGTSIWQVLQRAGANINATTSLDRTHFFATIATSHLELAIEIEADRMRNSFLTEEDRQSEMTVVRNEYERGENKPISALRKALWSTAFMSHAYGRPTIGWRDDIENVSIEKLREFYNTYYHPNNATAIVVGVFDRQKTLEMIAEHFGKIEPTPQPIPKLYTSERKQEGPKKVIVRRPGTQSIVALAFKAPPALDKDSYALQILDSVMSRGKTSLLYRELVDRLQLATDVSMSTSQLRYQGLIEIYANVTPGVSTEKVVEELLEQIQKVKEGIIGQVEVKRAIRKIRAQTKQSRDSSADVMFELNEAVASGDWRYYPTFLDEIAKVTADDIQRVAELYLVDDRQTLAVFEHIKADQPKDSFVSVDPFEELQMKHRHLAFGQISEQYVVPESVKGTHQYKFQEMAPNIKKTIIELRANSGSKASAQSVGFAQFFVLPTALKDTVILQGSLPAGRLYSPKGNEMIAVITAYMLDRGTRDKSKEDISNRLANLGAQISFDLDDYNVEFSLITPKKALKKTMALLFEQLKFPAFEEEELQKLKKNMIVSLENGKTNVRTRASISLSQAVYPEGHPNYEESLSQRIEKVKSVTSDDIFTFFGSVYGTSSSKDEKHMFNIVATGDIGEESEIVSLLVDNLSDWRSKPVQENEKTQNLISRPTTKPRDSPIVVKIPAKSNAILLIGMPIDIDEKHKDFIPLSIATFVLGGDFSARLMQQVRDKKGLTYGIGSSIDGSGHGKKGYISIMGTFSPSLLDQGLEATKEQIDKWLADGITQKELDDKKTSLIGSYRVGMETTQKLGARVLDIEQQDRPISWIDEFPEKIAEVTLEQANEAIKNHIMAKEMTIVKVGTIEK